MQNGDHMKNAKLLSCLHTYCLECIFTMTEGGAIKCPECNRLTPFNGDPETLRGNFGIQEMIAAAIEENTDSTGMIFIQVCVPVCVVLIDNTTELLYRLLLFLVIFLFSFLLLSLTQRRHLMMVMRSCYQLFQREALAFILYP